MIALLTASVAKTLQHFTRQLPSRNHSVNSRTNLMSTSKKISRVSQCAFCLAVRGRETRARLRSNSPLFPRAIVPQKTAQNFWATTAAPGTSIHTHFPQPQNNPNFPEPCATTMTHKCKHPPRRIRRQTHTPPAQRTARLTATAHCDKSHAQLRESVSQKTPCFPAFSRKHFCIDFHLLATKKRLRAAVDTLLPRPV